MEPLSSAAIAVATLILNKTFEKTGENLGEVVSSQIGKLWQLIKRKQLPQTTAIEQADQPVDFGKAVLEVESTSKNDAELAQVIEQLASFIEADPELFRKVQSTAEAVKQETSLIQNNAKLAEKIGLLVQGGTVNIENFTV